mmetsp:Transcript_24476/g.28848  ORF Transcript_24476/g.28848 Transcript_24476/m.28848 type:complete len:89 (+) Transcript_24476:1615-1881(+)|eukprot:CAMPEP_0185580884 /NCGR_PEP_ID=MMETSP0434-20130131/17963_1 /TAXON_ID=626734 ORGANISM="Favella taraikaensis, Strain Fe Narragansett Bay" /NCGR_SAMPLE_ID=MMETSP0434 /ASSEMBLY_ACC=CAM_ASM_000379 /LENGTH=88 /DNA_ID=CAMNT_0028199283 /DNA_START=1616 /DNA_END=1882 /DNA_ORIENTATION=+
MDLLIYFDLASYGPYEYLDFFYFLDLSKLTVISFVSPSEQPMLRKIEDAFNMVIPELPRNLDHVLNPPAEGGLIDESCEPQDQHNLPE